MLKASISDRFFTLLTFNTTSYVCDRISVALPYFRDLLLNNPIARYIIPLKIAQNISRIFVSALYLQYSHQNNQ
ncbi:hypothetical protein H6G35_07225 [Aulosira sp. FACHB-113]|uniref:hypothetical protein n=1 Tax=Tolypothrix tenuis TaxID=457083 RepID=UPI000BBC0B24|nr:hypothetical protein [Aulosira sp. FACHB-113]